MTQFLIQETEEKCVLVSHYTSTLNILEAFCKKKNYSFYRLDGSVEHVIEPSPTLSSFKGKHQQPSGKNT
jgi:SNF2 family DNA or RNA helicase